MPLIEHFYILVEGRLSGAGVLGVGVEVDDVVGGLAVDVYAFPDYIPDLVSRCFFLNLSLVLEL